MSFNDWKTEKLKNLTSKIGSGATPRGGKEAYLSEGPYALVRSQNILDFSFSYDGLAFISEDQAKKLDNVTLEENDVLLNITGDSVARVCQIPKKVLPARVNQHVAIIRPKKELLDNAYLKYFLLNPKFKDCMLGLSAVGATRNAITKAMIEDFDIFLPKLDLQKKIAANLSMLDEKIELNRQTNQTLEVIAQTLFKEWFLDFNFPGATGERVESELGIIAKEWEIGKLGDIYRTMSGGTPSRANLDFYSSGTIPWIKSKELDNTFIIETEEKISEEALKKSSAKIIPRHSVLIAMYGATVGEIGISSFESTCNQAICAFIPSIQYPYTYIFHFLKNNKEAIISRAVGSAQQNISQDLLKNLRLAIPPIKLLQDFHNITHPLFEQIENNLLQNLTLTELRNSLLPKLMKGEIELS